MTPGPSQGGPSEPSPELPPEQPIASAESNGRTFASRFDEIVVMAAPDSVLGADAADPRVVGVCDEQRARAVEREPGGAIQRGLGGFTAVARELGFARTGDGFDDAAVEINHADAVVHFVRDVQLAVRTDRQRARVVEG